MTQLGARSWMRYLNNTTLQLTKPEPWWFPEFQKCDVGHLKPTIGFHNYGPYGCFCLQLASLKCCSHWQDTTKSRGDFSILINQCSAVQLKSSPLSFHKCGTAKVWMKSNTDCVWLMTEVLLHILITSKVLNRAQRRLLIRGLIFVQDYASHGVFWKIPASLPLWFRPRLCSPGWCCRGREPRTAKSYQKPSRSDWSVCEMQRVSVMFSFLVLARQAQLLL